MASLPLNAESSVYAEACTSIQRKSLDPWSEVFGCKWRVAPGDELREKVRPREDSLWVGKITEAQPSGKYLEEVGQRDSASVKISRTSQEFGKTRLRVQLQVRDP